VQRQCVIAVNKQSANWDTVCLGGVRICDSPVDNDCNGIDDTNEPGQPCAPAPADR
jgi:hypothetical protein